jgi:hypothetical protein
MRQRFQKQYQFWLNLNLPEQDEIAGMIETLKERRSFAQTIRDGIRLIYSLREGRVDVLLSLFPWIANSLQPTSAANTEFASLLSEASGIPAIFTDETVIDPAESRANFAGGLGNLFDDNDDELWS